MRSDKLHYWRICIWWRDKLSQKKASQAIMVVESTPPQPPKTPNPIILFSDFDFKGTDQNLHDPMVIFVAVGSYIVRKVLVDQGSSADILYASTLQKCRYPNPTLAHIMETCWAFLENKLMSKESLS